MHPRGSPSLPALPGGWESGELCLGEIGLVGDQVRFAGNSCNSEES